MAATVEGREHLRLFFGLPLPASVAETLVAWQREVFGPAPHVRPVPPDHLHVTLVFLGSRPVAELPALRAALYGATGDGSRPVLTPARYRETDRVAMLVLDDTSDVAGKLQARLSEQLETLGVYRPERRRWLPHVTLARYRTRPRLRPELPGLGSFSPSDAALYHSVLRPDGAQYSIVEAVALGG